MVVLLLAALVACTHPKDTGDPADTSHDTSDPTDTSDTSDTTIDTGDSGTTGCVGDDDGRITFDEFVADPTLGLTAIYTTNDPGTVVDIPAPGGTDQGDGTWAWDFSATSDRTDVEWNLGIHPMEGAWFADAFPEGTYYVGLDSSDAYQGIYQVDEAGEALFLLGLASTADGEALLRYTEPVTVFDFPIALDKSWQTTTEAVGLYDGIEYPADYGVMGTVHLYHTYAFEADRQGEAHVPLGTFDVLRLALNQEMAAINDPYGEVSNTTQKAYFFVTECTGLVARIRSEDGERSDDFRKATEYLRLGF